MDFRKFLKLAVDARRAGQGPAHQAGQVVRFELVLLRAHYPPDAVAGLRPGLSIPDEAVLLMILTGVSRALTPGATQRPPGPPA